MASRAQMTESLPETLPADFGQWDDAHSTLQAVQDPHTESGPISEAGLRKANEVAATGRSGDLLEAVERPKSAREASGIVAGSRWPQPSTAALPPSRGALLQVHAAATAVHGVLPSAPPPNSASEAGRMTELFRSLPASLRANAVVMSRAAKEKRTIIAGASAALLVSLAAATTSLLNRDKLSPAFRPASTTLTTSTVQQPPKIAATARDHSKLTLPTSSTAEEQTRSEAERQRVQKDAEPQPQKAKTITDQLHTPTRLRVQAASLAPVPLPPDGIAAAGMDGSNSSKVIGAVFGSSNRPKVQIASQPSSSPREPFGKASAQQAISVPPSVALGLLIKENRPIYPSIAKSARVSGTVVLAATISRTGTVENLRVVSGPEMLRNSAVEAVRTWRFKPYVVNSQPTPFGTMINLHFALNN